MKKDLLQKIAAGFIIAVLGFSAFCVYVSRRQENGGNEICTGRGLPYREEKGRIHIKTACSPKPLAEGEREVKALAEAYSRQIEKIEIRGNEWALLLDDVWFYWQGGRLLPESKIDRRDKYKPYAFYDYMLNLPLEVIVPDEEQLKRREKSWTRPFEPSFLNALYGGSSYREIRKRIKTIRFLGFQIDAHEKIVPRLKAIEEEIRELEEEDGTIARFIGELENIDCFSWREIDGSMSRSYHSYGIAVDLITSDPRGKAIYWIWTRYYSSSWYEMPYEQRWMVPEEIVDIFEKYGFIWGGKWLFYDNMHFEYRPELLILAGRDVKTPEGFMDKNTQGMKFGESHN